MDSTWYQGVVVGVDGSLESLAALALVLPGTAPVSWRSVRTILI